MQQLSEHPISDESDLQGTNLPAHPIFRIFGTPPTISDFSKTFPRLLMLQNCLQNGTVSLRGPNHHRLGPHA
jgi:hypothetical protein